MKILVLGNGFDIDHNLPTSYMDFLNFCNAVLGMDNPASPYLQKLKVAQKDYIEKLKQSGEERKLFISLIEGNHLLHYFNSRLAKQGVNWIDFEREIREIVGEFRSIETALRNSTQYHFYVDQDHKLHQILCDLGLKGMDTNQWDEIHLNALHADFSVSLDRFSRALEYYIATFINETEIDGVCPDIINFDATQVLTFNYSNTYERVYGGVRWNESIDHIHGIATPTVENETNIILGITTKENGTESRFVEVEKYYQRITKRTGHEYKKWVQSKNGLDEKLEVMFFGHSLDATDSDVIEDLICNENADVQIYYYNENSYRSIVANLVSIIGKEELIRKVSGKNPSIRFIKQSAHTRGNTAGLEITRDIRMLYKMYLLTDVAVQELIKKILDRVSSRDLQYFYSQRKTISLYDALNEFGITEFCYERALEICTLLPYETKENSQLAYLDEEDWNDFTPWGQEIPCSVLTRKLINAVNEKNRETAEETDRTKKYWTIVSSKNSAEISEELIRILSETEPTEIFWREMDELIRLMYNKEHFEKALKRIKKKEMPLHMRARIRHFSNAYDEYDFEVEYNRHMAECYEEYAEYEE